MDKRSLFRDLTLEIFRLNHGEAISDQAIRWTSSERILNVKNDDVYVHYSHYILLASLIIKHHHSLPVNDAQVNEFKQLQESLSNEEVALLEYCKYAIRRSTKPTLNAGLTCASFILLCITVPLISDKIPEYKGEFPPALKYGNESRLSSGVPLKYSRAINLIRTKRPKLPDETILRNALNLESPGIMNLIYFSPKIEGYQHSRIPVRTYQEERKQEISDKTERQSVIGFLQDNGIENLEELHTQFKESLKNLAPINPKIASLELLYDSLKEFHKETNVSSVSSLIETFHLKSLASSIYNQLTRTSLIAMGVAGLGLFTLYKRVTSSQIFTTPRPKSYSK